MGEIHYSIYKQLEYLLSYEERFNLHRIILTKIKQSLNYLNLCDHFSQNKNIKPDEFLDIFINTIPSLPILGYLYFEAISEYLMLFQDNENAKKYAEVGELYNPTYKELMYTLCPQLRYNFKLNSFKPRITEIQDQLEYKKIFKKLNPHHLKKWIMERLAYLTKARLLNNESLDWCAFLWNLEGLAKHVKSMVGHLIHRELRNFNRYPSFYFYFDQTKALQVWNYWNHMDLEVIFNGVIPKGEVGINPALPNLKYRIYKGRKYSANGFWYVEPTEELNIKIEPKLVDLRYTTMRGNYKK